MVDPIPVINEPVRRREAPNGLLTVEEVLDQLWPSEYRVLVDGFDITPYVHAFDEREGWAVMADVRHGFTWALCTGRVVLQVK